jgi:hypothetical protein
VGRDVISSTQGLAYSKKQDEESKMIHERHLINASKFLRRVYVGKLDEQDLHDTIIALETEVINRRKEKANAASRDRTIR